MFACEKRSYKSFNDLKVGEYEVKKFSAVETKYGTRVRVDCEGFYVFLPERLSTAKIIAVDNIERMNSREQIMIYRGKDVEAKGRYVDFFFVFKFRSQLTILHDQNNIFFFFITAWI